MRQLTYLIFTFFSLFYCTNLSAQKVEANWESINKRGYPQWFNDAKLGIFIHWGVYSVPAYSGKEGYAEWYYRAIMLKDSARVKFQKENFGENFTYRDFDKLFKAELWNPDDWAELFKESGAKYVLLVTKHHDGYCLWDSKFQPNWNSVVGGPKRNIVEELTKSVRDKGLKMCFYYSLTEWTNPLHIWMQSPDNEIGKYVDTYMIPQFKELVSKYKPSAVFTDGEWNNSAKQFKAEELISWYYNTVGEEAIVNDRWGSGGEHGFRTPEYSSGIMQTDRPWAECRGLGRSFAMNRNEPLSNYLTSDELIKHFVKLVAAGGGMTLNVGPYADGRIPLLQQERLLDLGKWLKINSEAIYGTRPYKHFYEFEKVKVFRVDSLINFNWVRNSPDKKISYDNFTAKWEGVITPEYSEKYTFEVTVDDDVEVLLNNKPIINYVKEKANSAEGNAQEAANFGATKATVKLKKGKNYSLVVNYKEKNLEAVMKLLWSSKSQPLEAVPAKRTDGYNAEYTCMQPWVCFTTKESDLYAITLRFPEDLLVLKDLPEPKKDMKVTMLGCEKELPWKYENGKLEINTSVLKYSDLQSTAAWAFKLEGLNKMVKNSKLLPCCQ